MFSFVETFLDKQGVCLNLVNSLMVSLSKQKLCFQKDNSVYLGKTQAVNVLGTPIACVIVSCSLVPRSETKLVFRVCEEHSIN
jgi:hypothetical protein